MAPSPLKLTSEDVAIHNHLIMGNSVSALEIGVQKAKNRIALEAERVQNLRANEAIVKARYYKTLDQAYIDLRLTAGRDATIDPQLAQQDIKQSDHAAPPTYSYNKDQLYNKHPELVAIEAELNKIDNELCESLRIINDYKKTIEQYELEIQFNENQAKLSVAGKAGKIFSAVGDAISGTLVGRADIAKDSISRSIETNLQFIYALAKKFQNYTTDAATGTRKFPDNPEWVVKSLVRIREAFWAHAQSFPELNKDTTVVEQGKSVTYKKLNYSDPACIPNLKNIERIIKIHRGALSDVKVTPQIEKYINQVVVVATSPSGSKYINKNANPGQPASKSLKSATDHVASVMSAIGDSFAFSVQMPTLGQAFSKLLKIKSAKYMDLPVCPGVTKPPATDTDVKKDTARGDYDAAMALGAENFQESLAAAQSFQAAQNSKNLGLLGELPLDAPKWVVDFTVTHKDGDYGIIYYAVNDLPLSATATPSSIVESGLVPPATPPNTGTVTTVTVNGVTSQVYTPNAATVEAMGRSDTTSPAGLTQLQQYQAANNYSNWNARQRGTPLPPVTGAVATSLGRPSDGQAVTTPGLTRTTTAPADSNKTPAATQTQRTTGTSAAQQAANPLFYRKNAFGTYVPSQKPADNVDLAIQIQDKEVIQFAIQQNNANWNSDFASTEYHGTLEQAYNLWNLNHTAVDRRDMGVLKTSQVLPSSIVSNTYAGAGTYKPAADSSATWYYGQDPALLAAAADTSASVPAVSAPTEVPLAVTRSASLDQNAAFNSDILTMGNHALQFEKDSTSTVTPGELDRYAYINADKVNVAFILWK